MSKPESPPRSRRSLGQSLLRLVRQPFRSLHYKTAYALWSRDYLLDPALFSGKRVLIAGAASGVTDELTRFSPGDWDVIVRMNKAIDTPLLWNGQQVARCDVLFQMFGGEGRIRASGLVTAEKLRKTGTQIVVHRTSGKSLFTRTLAEARRLRREGADAVVRIIPPAFYRVQKKALGNHSATSGAIAILWFLGCDTADLGIVGFSFYTTRYMPGYQDNVATDAEAMTYGRFKDIHDPVAERALIARRVAEAQAAGKRITLGHEVARVLSGA